MKAIRAIGRMIRDIGNFLLVSFTIFGFVAAMFGLAYLADQKHIFAAQIIMWIISGISVVFFATMLGTAFYIWFKKHYY